MYMYICICIYVFMYIYRGRLLSSHISFLNKNVHTIVDRWYLWSIRHFALPDVRRYQCSRVLKCSMINYSVQPGTMH